MPHKLLLADDSVTIQRVIELTFADEDIAVIAVGDGRQAIERALAERPDIVLADVGMPERDGYEVAAFIKGRPELAHIPVLLLTGAFEPIDEGRARAAQCDGVLVKPFEPQMVINRVKDLIAGRRPALGAAPAAPAFPAVDPSAPPTSVDEYFDRLDAAFSAKDGAPADAASGRPQPRATQAEPDASSAAADLAGELAAWEPELQGSSSSAGRIAAGRAPASQVEGAPAPRTDTAPPSPGPVPTLAEAFAELLSAEQRRPFAPSSLDRAAVSEEAVEQVTRRVIERMTDAAVREVVVDVAERLVREEIERIKTQGS
jgi:CheY-like chemotaxis protein